MAKEKKKDNNRHDDYIVVNETEEWLQRNINQEFANGDFFRIVMFYILRSPCKKGSYNPVKLESYGWKNPWYGKALKNLIDTAAGFTEKTYFYAEAQKDFKELWSGSGFDDNFYDIKDLDVNFQNRFVGGFARDWGDSNFSTTKFAWQTWTAKNLFTYKNEDAKFAASAGINAQTHASLYGTGDTMGIVRGGPFVKTQYKSWQQYLGYYLGGQAGDSPFYFDKNFYGKSNVVLGESLRISKYLTLMYTTTIVVAGDTPNGRTQQENRIYFLIGPDDVKFMIGYDMYRRNAAMGFMLNVGAENSDITFNRLVLQDPQAIGKAHKTEKQKINEEQKKAEEEKRIKQQQSNIMERSVLDYDDYNSDELRMPGGTMLQPSIFRPIGM